MFDKTHLLSLVQTGKTSATNIFYTQKIPTPIGTVLAIADENFLYCSIFYNEIAQSTITKLLKTYNAKLTIKPNAITELVKIQLSKYFNQKLKNFSIPLKLTGTDFQVKCWQELLKIPYGKTISYLDEAKNIGKPTAFRAVANANGKNLLPIIIPCHRVISSNGRLGGYTGGVEKKVFLLENEKS